MRNWPGPVVAWPRNKTGGRIQSTEKGSFLLCATMVLRHALSICMLLLLTLPYGGGGGLVVVGSRGATLKVLRVLPRIHTAGKLSDSVGIDSLPGRLGQLWRAGLTARRGGRGLTQRLEWR